MNIYLRDSIDSVYCSDSFIITENNVNNIILHSNDGNKDYYFDLGSFCYINYKKQPKENIINKDEINYTRRKYIKKLITSFLKIDTTPSVLQIIYLEFNHFFSFYNKEFSGIEFSYYNFKKAYLEYSSVSSNLNTLPLKQYITAYLLSVLLDEYFESFTDLVKIDYSKLKNPIQLQSYCKSIFTYRNVNIIDLDTCKDFSKSFPIEDYVFTTTLGNRIMYQMDLGSLLYFRRYPHQVQLKQGERFRGNKVDIRSLILNRKLTIEKFKNFFINLKLSNKSKLQLFRIVKSFLDYIDNKDNSQCNLSDSIEMIGLFKKFISINFPSTKRTYHKCENIKFLCFFISVCSNFDIGKLFSIANIPFDENKSFSQLFLSINNKLSKRDINIIDLTSIADNDTFPDITKITLLFKSKSQTRHFDLGSYCYHERTKISKTKVSAQYSGNLVNIDTLIIERKISLEKFLISLCSFSSNINTIWSMLKDLGCFLDYIDENHKYCTFIDPSKMKKIYHEFTFHLIHRINISPINGRPLQKKTATNYQYSARKFIAACLDVTELDVLSYAIEIKQNQSEVTEPVKKNILQENFRYNKVIFESIYNFLINNASFPLKIELTQSNSLVLYAKNIIAYKPTDALNINCMRQDHFLLYDELVNFLEDNTQDSYILSRYDETYKYYNETNFEFHRERLYLANVACHAFLNLFFAETGVNVETALSIKLSNIDIIASRKGFRSLTAISHDSIDPDNPININNIIKKRALNKSLDIEISIKFKPLFLKFLAFRTWLCQSGLNNEYLFIYPSVKDRGKSNYDLESISNYSLNEYKKWLKTYIPDCTWITPTEYRKTKAYLISELSDGDIEITAKVLGNNINTVKRYYSEYNTDEYLSDMNRIITEIRDLAFKKAGFQSFEAPQILDNQSNHIETISGHCQNQTLDPTSLTGSTVITPTPDCNQKQNCLFCQHFLIHADEKDIAKLLTLKWWLAEHTGSNNLTSQLSMKRIETFLEALIQTDPKYKSLIEKIQSDIEIGKYPNFWDRRLQIIYAVYEEVK